MVHAGNRMDSVVLFDLRLVDRMITFARLRHTIGCVLGKVGGGASIQEQENIRLVK